jgi:hypothetical protein
MAGKGYRKEAASLAGTYCAQAEEFCFHCEFISKVKIDASVPYLLKLATTL